VCGPAAAGPLPAADALACQKPGTVNLSWPCAGLPPSVGIPVSRAPQPGRPHTIFFTSASITSHTGAIWCSLSGSFRSCCQEQLFRPRRWWRPPCATPDPARARAVLDGYRRPAEVGLGNRVSPPGRARKSSTICPRPRLEKPSPPSSHQELTALQDVRQTFPTPVPEAGAMNESADQHPVEPAPD